ncbi:MAG: ATP-binding cassette domain-containing protein [Pseudomonadota bacterium]
MITIVELSKVLGDRTVLKDISLEIVTRGSIVGLAGPSGSGKSTLLRCIQGLDEGDTGTIYGLGYKGFLFQDFQLFPHMSVLENITYAPIHVLGELDAENNARQLLRQLNLEEFADVFPGQLSGGQKQRVALARALAMHPDTLLCDEPTSGLDVVSIQDVVRILQTVKKTGTILVVASHDLEFLSSIADRIVILKAGQIVADLMPQAWEQDLKTLKQYY